MTAEDCIRQPGEVAACLGTRMQKPDGTVGPGKCVLLARGAPGSRPCLVTRNAAVPTVRPFDQDAWDLGVGDDHNPPERGYYCDLKDGVTCDTKSVTCEPRSTTGQRCSQGFDCIAEDFCAEGNPSTCQPRLADGASCAAHAGDAPCKAGSFCEYESHRCRPYVADGAACGGVIAINRIDPCRDDSFCDPASRRCTRKAAVGAACTANAMCEYGCSKGRCSSPHRLLAE